MYFLLLKFIYVIYRKNMERNKIDESKSEKQKPKGEVIQITDQEQKKAPRPPIQHSYVIQSYTHCTALKTMLLT